SPTEVVLTQEKEVDRVHGILKTQYEGAGDKKTQILALASILKPMADTIAQRQALIAYQTHLRDQKTFAALQQRLKDADAATMQRQKEAQPKPYEEAFHAALALTFTDPLGPLAEGFLAAKKANKNATVDEALKQSLDNVFTQLQSQFEQM